MSGDTPPQPRARPPIFHAALRAVRALGVTPGTLAFASVAVPAAVGFAAFRSDSSVHWTDGYPVVAVSLILLATWGVARWLRSALEVRKGDPARSIAAWCIGAAVVLLIAAWAAAQFPSVAVVELGLLTCLVLGRLVALSDRLRLDSRVSTAAVAAIFLLVIGAAGVRATAKDDPQTTYSVAGPRQLTNAAKTGETVRLRGRSSNPYVEASLGYEAGPCTSVPVVEVKRSLLGFETQRIEVAMSACWEGDDVATLVVQQFARSPWGTAVIEPVLLRSGSVFDADPLSGSIETRKDVPRYRDIPVDVDDVIADPYSAAPGIAGQDRPRPPLLDDQGNVNDDDDGANDTVLARVTSDRSSVSVVAAFAVRYPSLSQFDRDNDPTSLGLEGSPPPKQLWLERFQPRGRELVVAIGNLSKDSAGLRLVHFTDGGQQPWAMSEGG